MNIQYKTSFARDVKKASKEVQIDLQPVIEILKSAKDLNSIHNLKKLKGFSNAYRIRVDKYRLCLFFENDIVTLVRFLPRKEVYRYFP